jgi:hypothetical protein
MEETEAQARMWADLLAGETQVRTAAHDVTRRAELYLHAGLPLERVLDALRISRATWYRRVAELREHEDRLGDGTFRWFGIPGLVPKAEDVGRVEGEPPTSVPVVLRRASYVAAERDRQETLHLMATQGHIGCNSHNCAVVAAEDDGEDHATSVPEDHTTSVLPFSRPSYRREDEPPF